MFITTHRDCYGRMLPDVLTRDPTGDHSGKNFAYRIDNIGLSRSQRSVEVDMAARDDCLRCPEFETSYKLSLEKLALQSAISES